MGLGFWVVLCEVAFGCGCGFCAGSMKYYRVGRDAMFNGMERRGGCLHLNCQFSKYDDEPDNLSTRSSVCSRHKEVSIHL